MLIEKKIAEYLIYSTESIIKALEKINSNKKRIVFVISNDGQLCGSLSDGDFRRWVTSSSEIELTKEVEGIVNVDVKSALVTAPRGDISALFSDSIDIIPLVDEFGRVVAIASNKDKGISIGERCIAEDSPSFIIAEIGNNHNGDIELAKELIDLASDAGADCVKFQMRDLGSLYKTGCNTDKSADLGAQYTHDLLTKFQLSNDQLIEVFDHCKLKGLSPLCTPWDIKSLEVLEAYGMEAYKVASADFTNHELLDALASTGKPLICSTGMCTEIEIKKSVDFLKSRGVDFVALHCNSTYPAPFKDVNLNYMHRLKKVVGGLVGYSGHERGISVPTAAVALGAKVIEKHFTVDKTMEGNDHKVSLLPDEFRSMVEQIREVEQSLGNDDSRSLSQGEMINRETLAKSLVANKKISEGEMITRDMVAVKSPGQGLQPLYIDELVGCVAKRDFDVNDFFYESDLVEETVVAKEYGFDRPFGIPVRYHDYQQLMGLTNLDFVEFHLSYQDLELDLDEFFCGEEGIGFAVHSPELFSDDHIMNLASNSDEYRKQSICELNRVCDITRRLKAFFPKTDCPIIVINAGGYSETSFLPSEQRGQLYELVASSLDEVDQSGVEIVIQTMPPFPWHFGGQSHHNLFVDPQEIKDFCETYNYRICYDVSHSMMACNYYNWDLREFTRKIGKFNAHMHIVDALGVDGEGVQIGDGNVDFSALASDLQQFSPNIQFIPEVWQGHKNSGEGFWYALNFLEPYFNGN